MLVGIIIYMIHWKNINLSFKEKKIFNNYNLTINTGEKVLLNAKSGMGKTTLLKTLLGLTPLDSGNVFVDRTPLNPVTVNQIRAKIFYLNQDITLADCTVNEIILDIFSYKSNRNLKLSKTDLLNYLDKFDLERSILDKMSKDLSGGERQRVGLIIGLLLDRPIWLLDEPTSALDKNMKKKVKNTILGLNKTIMIISHDSCWTDIKRVDWGNNNG